MAKRKQEETSLLKNKEILIIEDDVFLVKAYQLKFEKEGLEVNIASDGKTALAFLKQAPPAVVLLDLMLPGISGMAILEEIKKNSQWKDVPVIILSNLGQPQDIEHGLALGAVEYLVKANIKITDVVDLVKKYL